MSKIHKNKYGKYVIPDNHNTEVARHIRRGTVWEPHTINFVQKNINNKSIITAGTYLGDFLPAFSSFTSKSVYAFEPVPENYDLAMKTIELNNLTNVILENKALSNKEGVLYMQTWITIKGKTIKMGGCSRVVEEKDSHIKVDCIVLDTYLSKLDEISIIQLDVERHEDLVLMGCKNIIDKFLPILIVENKPTVFYNEHLSKLNYKYHKRKLHYNSILYIEGKHKLKF